MSTSNSLYYCSYSQLHNLSNDLSDFDCMLSIAGVYAAAGNIVDRLGKIKTPINYKIYSKCEMPTSVDNFNMSYEECALNEAINLLKESDRLGKRLLLMYSGGVDSTAILVSLMMVLPISELREKVWIAMTPDSIHENANLYYNIILKNFKVVSSAFIDQYCSKDWIIVVGDLADTHYVPGHLVYVTKKFGGDISGVSWKDKDLYDKWWAYCKKRELLTKDERIQRDTWWQLLESSIESAPFAIDTVADFFWWMHFNFRWQHVYFGYTLTRLPSIDQDLVDNHYRVFFSSQDFQKWAITKGRYQLNNKEYKEDAKALIYKLTKDGEYYGRKGKRVSLPKLMTLSPLAKSIASDYSFVDSDHIFHYYDRENNFKHPI